MGGREVGSGCNVSTIFTQRCSGVGVGTASAVQARPGPGRLLCRQCSDPRGDGRGFGHARARGKGASLPLKVLCAHSKACLVRRP